VFSCATRPIGTTWIASAGAWRRIGTDPGRASQGPGMHTASPRLTGRQRMLLLGALTLLSCATLGFQVLQVAVLSLQLFPEAAFLVVSLSMLGLGSGGSLASAFVRRRASGNPLGSLWGCAIGFSLTILG